MAAIFYNLTEQLQLKNISQEVVNKTAVKLGFTTARKSLKIRIRFKKGASHKSWNSGKLTDSQELAEWLTGGFRAGGRSPRIAKRPVFDRYLELYSQEIKDLCVRAFKGSGSIKEKAYKAGRLVLNDMKHKIYSGSIPLALNHGQYLKRKRAAGYGDTPLVATKQLFEDLEVVII